MRITVDGQSFDFDDGSEVKIEAEGYDLYIEEPGFDRETEETEHWATSKPITLPVYIEAQVNRNSTVRPCSKVFKDSKGRRRLYTYFD